MHSCDTGRILAFVIRIRLIILLCTGLNRTGIALPASSSLREREIAFRHRPNTSSGRRGVFSHMIHRSKRRFRGLESNVEFSGGVCGGGFDASESRTPKARKGIVSSILIEVLENIYGIFVTRCMLVLMIC